MARLQILELPEGSGDDRPPFALVVDEYVARRYITGLDQPEPVSEFDGIAEKVDARAVLVFEETVDIPANNLSSSGDEVEVSDADFAEMASAVRRALGIDMTEAGVKPDIAGWLLTACRELEKSEGARASLNQHKVALLDALGMDRTRDWDDIRNAARALRKQRDELTSTSERVRQIHHRQLQDDRYEDTALCASDAEDWPCPTIQALNGDTERTPEE
jgi:hypothetical protein